MDKKKLIIAAIVAVGALVAVYFLAAKTKVFARFTAPPPPNSPAPALSVANPTVKRGDMLRYSFGGFTPSTQYYSGFREGGQFSGRTDTSGKGQIAFQVGDQAGQYTLYVEDAVGKQASVKVTVTA